MSAEKQQSQQYPVDAIHYYPKDKRLVIEVEGGLSFALNQTPEGLFAQLLLNEAVNQRSAALFDDVVPAAEPVEAARPTVSGGTESASVPEPVIPSPAISVPPETPAVPNSEAAEATTAGMVASVRDPAKGEQRQFTGRLKADPREGRPDSNGLPTAWAPLSVHQEGKDEALMLAASFHKATRPIALGLHSGDQITVRGYHHPTTDPKRMDSLRVYMFINYFGKTSRKEP